TSHELLVTLIIRSRFAHQEHMMYRVTKHLTANHPGLLLFSLAALVALWLVQRPSQPAGLTSSSLVAWWAAPSAVSIFNVCCWRISAAALARQRESVVPALYQFQCRQLLLSAVFVLGCGFRSILPRADVQRMGLIDSWMSSVMVGRSVATIAELCFMAQWALLLNLVAREAGSRFGVVVSWLVVPLICGAELCSWGG